MNIFYVDSDPFEAARCLGDRHITKMLVESLQLLSGVYHMEGANLEPPDTMAGTPYRKTHYNHPCAIWARSDKSHWTWLLNHASGLYAEFLHRWPGKAQHGCLGALSYMIAWPPTWLFSIEFTEPPQCMPETYKSDNTIHSFREYYRVEKSHLHKWTRRTPPNWIGRSSGFSVATLLRVS